MNERYEYVTKEIDKLNDAEYDKYTYSELKNEIDKKLKEIKIKKNNEKSSL